jgi:hypothetical protein
MLIRYRTEQCGGLAAAPPAYPYQQGHRPKAQGKADQAPTVKPFTRERPSGHVHPPLDHVVEQKRRRRGASAGQGDQRVIGLGRIGGGCRHIEHGDGAAVAGDATKHIQLGVGRLSETEAKPT